jgi:L-threonylcarbamoyladenylate synthase
VPRYVLNSSARIGLRIPAHNVARAIAQLFAAPLTTTSANLSGQKAALSGDGVKDVFDGKIELIIDAGTSAGGTASTVLDVTGDVPVMLRQGGLSINKIMNYWDS